MSVRSLLLGLCASFFALRESSAQVQPRSTNQAASGVLAVRRDPSGAAGTNVGDEVDLVMNFHLTTTSDFMVVYAQLFGEGFLQATSTATKSSSQEAVYAMYNFRW